jgi:ferredoxin
MRRLKRFYPVSGSWSFVMPNNYIPGFDVDGPELERRKILAAEKRLERVSEGILQKKREYDVQEGSAAGIKTTVIRPLFNTFARSTRPFYVTDSCNGCKICETGCPTGTIKIRQGKPVWEHPRCAQCMRCINLCPQVAIQYGKATVKRGRYHFIQP